MSFPSVKDEIDVFHIIKCVRTSKFLYPENTSPKHCYLTVNMDIQMSDNYNLVPIERLSLDYLSNYSYLGSRWRSREPSS